SATISVIDLSISLPQQFILIVDRHICSGGDVTAVTKKMIHAGAQRDPTYFLLPPERLFMERLIPILVVWPRTHMEAQMKLTIPAILITALMVAPPAALAQGYSGSSSNPATSVSKDETTSMTKQSKKRMASHKKKHHVKKSKSETTGSGSSSPKKY